ncbi:type VI secretion system ATPase TssH [Sphingomonas sp. R-74633]|uniref:type VI secretion system ATPase TssH n=1 Tax=Sphingomonas sp. R-74633 TaxID=2751188 RepID=UPI001C550867|nr:type VI secretion system ATPase TssH [Sphingomonas sp. R-74633]
MSRTCSDALERAAGRCLVARNYAVEIEHLFTELVEQPDTDFARALDRYGMDRRALADALSTAARRYPAGNTGAPGVSDRLAAAVEKAWGVASIDLAHGTISSACLLRAAIEDAGLRERLLDAVPAFAGVPRERFGEDLADIVASGREGAGGPLVAGGMAVAAEGSALDAYTIDLTTLAREGGLDPVVGRDAEIDQVIEILMRRRQNNPILTGDAGVGKTAVVEGLAQRIAAGQVPEALVGVAVRSLDLGLLQAGASVKGEYERRLRGVIAEVNGTPDRIVLFIDEAHMLIGAGGAAGQGDAANLLKPALARGGLRTIAATTWAEYKRYFEKDAALARRFHPVKIEQPDAATTIAILRQLSGRLERFHGLRITEDALAAAAHLSQRYIAERKLPDKAINVLDTACARVAIAQSCRPASLDAAEARLADLTAELDRLGADPEDRLDQLETERDAAQDLRDAIASRWEQERYTFDRLRTLEKQAEADDPELQGLRLELAEIQQDTPLVPVAVDRRAVADVVSAWTGVPLDAILGSASSTARDLKAQLSERIVGQDAALDTIVRRVQTFQAGLGDPAKPTGVFLLCGPSGVGKTETALALADLLFGGQRALITVNMSEYQAAHSVSGLKGAPPGYVGYGKGGVLTEAVRRQPYSVVLLDEVEKAHPDVLEIFYQVFDRGMLEDSEGVAVDFTHTLILLTSNLGTELLAAGGPEEAIAAGLQAELGKHFPPAFLARLVVVPYRPLAAAEIEAIVRLKLARVGERFTAARRGELTYDEKVVKAIARAADIADGGARSVDAIIAHQLLPELSIRLLDRLAEAAPARAAHLSVASDGRLRIEISR